MSNPINICFLENIENNEKLLENYSDFRVFNLQAIFGGLNDILEKWDPIIY
jgi:hypothetical protein